MVKQEKPLALSLWEFMSLPTQFLNKTCKRRSKT